MGPQPVGGARADMASRGGSTTPRGGSDDVGDGGENRSRSRVKERSRSASARSTSGAWRLTYSLGRTLVAPPDPESESMALNFQPTKAAKTRKTMGSLRI